ncbi:DNA adenine methylase [Sphingomonas sp. NSE70-1]|uniref:site-specific DNA-methyltransferase (adenine-specific) n=1 Tax=Sphingomonas caseinilyticus TaxID=2908205 RepID=A0ABT0RX11_9SPHN|nr:DNA adenine methylase [Sphingomonas caseinilyticus]MCL6699542.1 DNA adenine methylase [Sphingomonas caseinilyticus]
MTGRISYMGTKHDLADRVAQVIADCRPGRLLDAFAGMGAVAEAHAGKRQVWTNDVQHFAYLAGRCRFTDPIGPMPASKMRKLATPVYRQNMACLREQNRIAWKAAVKLPAAVTFDEFDHLYQKISAQEINRKDAYGCFTGIYANTYFSLTQCAEIDSIRCALDALRGRGEVTPAQFDWGLLALGHAALRLANTTGHFAQYLRPSAKNLKRVTHQFGRSIFDQWLASLGSLLPSGTPDWRRDNLASRSDCDSLLRTIRQSGDVGVVYCDPPYTDDQYSRFYHIWETLVLYDYPVVTGVGLYRPDRFTTDFSLRSKVADAFKALVEEVASTGADLVLSYPSNGLLHDVGLSPLEVLKGTYSKAELVTEIQHSHSTMGASKGQATAAVAECIYLARA